MHRPSIGAQARHDWLLGVLATHGAISSRNAAETLGCSLETIRKDLVMLERNGALRRAHGGALPHTALTYEAPVEQRTEHSERKARIAQAALGEIPEGSAVYLESGSTTAALAEVIPVDFILTVFTNSLPIATTLLSRPRVECHLIGGRVRPITKATTGHWALRELADITLDIAVLGCNAISNTGELATPDSDEAAAKAAALSVAGATMLLADRSKFNRRALFRYATLEDITLLITDQNGDDTLPSNLEHIPQRALFV
jgi:DeoR family fructose operon transcriptional repressor